MTKIDIKITNEKLLAFVPDTKILKSFSRCNLITIRVAYKKNLVFQVLTPADTSLPDSSVRNENSFNSHVSGTHCSITYSFTFDNHSKPQVKNPEDIGVGSSVSSTCVEWITF